jgi:hypothetical protein
VGSLEDAEFDGAPAVDSPPERPISHGEGPGTTSFFQIGTSGKAIVYVIDHSASMGQNNALAAAKAELARSLCRLPASARFQVIAYNRTAQPLRINGRIDLVPATEANKHEAALLLDLLSAEGGTEHLPALRQALALRPEVIFFLTDAADLEPRQVRELTLRNQGGSVIHAIELNRASCRRKGSVLQALAKDNGGVYRVIALGPRAMN